MSFQEFEPIFNTLNEEFEDLQVKIKTLMNKYSNLEKQLKHNSNAKFKCRKCNEYFENVEKFQDHKENSETCDANPYPFQCEKCELAYTSEKQLSSHQEKHGRFPCEKCEKIFSFEVLLEKHMTAVHGKMHIYCHYYNNNKQCPFSEECIFAHKIAKECIYGNQCERMYCMFKHDEHFQNNEEESDDENEIDENECEEIYDLDTVRLSDIEPVLAKVEIAMKKANDLLKGAKLNCENCDFVAKNQNGLNMHKKAKHTDKSS